MTEEIKDEMISLRKKIIENEFSELNNMQRSAVLSVKGPLLILAGAGSGKTTVLVNRVAHILRWGEAYESDSIYGEYSGEETALVRLAAEGNAKLSDELVKKLSVSGVYPWRILAITFTNKAANELKERICKRVGEPGKDIWASTFHSCCTRILRRFGENLGFTSHFTIYDADDQKRLIKDCMKALDIDEKMLPVKSVIAEISNAKDSMTDPEEYKSIAQSDSRLASISRVYELYQKRLLASDAMDFDDIICNTVQLFNKFPEVLEHYSEQFRYIMVDEYQDTNRIQYELVRMLASKHHNLCVVGDDDQSIYKFRGATIRNILDFEKDFEAARTIRLEQNYRSTKNILSAANKVISNNYERKDKTLWTENKQGNKITVYSAADERDESDYIARDIQERVEKGGKYSDNAILYRMNSQSQSIERAFIYAGIPYKIIGGRRFYERREIRDMIAYLAVISNHSDNIRLKRIINVPKRGIGDKTVNLIEEISASLGQSMIDTMRQSDEFEALAKSSKKLREFCEMIDALTAMETGNSIHEMYIELLKRLDYRSYITKSADYTESAAENVEELANSITQYENEAAGSGEEPSLQGFLEETALLTDIDGLDNEGNCTVMMTLHNAKGLEFDNVYIPGMEENVFPGYQSTLSENDMQEERRLAYVGITRARKELTLIHAANRMVFGHTNRNRPSRFIAEIPDELKNPVSRVITPVELPEMEIPNQKNARRADLAASKIITSVVSHKPAQSFTIGMRVRHKTFGEGSIIDIKPMAKDNMLEIAFDSVGTKKLMSSFANLTIL